MRIKKKSTQLKKQSKAKLKHLGRNLFLGALFMSVVFSPAIILAEKYSGITIEAKLIGGGQYERLYTRINQWEKKTGAKVKIISKKNHFDLDREIKSDIAAGTVSWCVGSNHSSFVSQYPFIYTDLKALFSKNFLNGFVESVYRAGTVKKTLQMVPRAQFDVRALYYKKSVYASKKNKAAFLKKHGYPLTLPKTWKEVKTHAIFFSQFPDLYGHQFAGKDEALTGTFYEFLISEGGKLLDENDHYRPKFNSKAGIKALQWFKDLYQAKAVPAGTISYLWDDLASGFASGNIAINLDWPGWAGYFNDPKNSKIAGDVGILPPPKGGVRPTGWSGVHGFSITKKCKNKKAAASLVEYLTSDEAQLFESARGSLPTRTKTWKQVKSKIAKSKDTYQIEKLAAFEQAMSQSFPVPKIPEWIEFSNILYPYLQKAILGDLTIKKALAQAEEKVDELMRENGYY